MTDRHLHDDLRRHREWLDAERDEQDDLAELMFARLMTTLPVDEPNRAFVEETVAAAWRARARRRLVTQLARVAAAVLVAAGAVAVVYVLGVFAAGAVVRGVVFVAHGLVWLASEVGGGVRWWVLAARVGSAVSQTVTQPTTMAAVAAIELLGAMAIYGFQRVLRDGPADHR